MRRRFWMADGDSFMFSAGRFACFTGGGFRGTLDSLTMPYSARQWGA